MQIKLAWILDSEVEQQYNLNYEGEEVVITQIRDILRQAKKRFNIKGRKYIMVAGDKTFFIAKSRKDWNVYQIGVDFSEQDTER